MKKEKGLLSVLGRKNLAPPPLWLMRQAGRYLPEYRQLRVQAGSFWAMALDPKYAAEVTLQPIRRFGFDAAILFSDILVVPRALGCEVTFAEGEGPNLVPISDCGALERDNVKWLASLAPVYEALHLVRAELSEETALLGFAGAPWTLATYLAAGGGGDEQRAAKLWGYRDPKGFERLLDLLAECVAFHLCAQIEAGADAVQIFDSWASGLPESAYSRWIVMPTRNIVKAVRAKYPKAKIIGFPRASTLAGYELYAVGTGVDAVSVDTAAPWSWMKGFAKTTVVQGNLDPLALIAGGAALDESVDEILEAMEGTPFIFNLGHGILPETPIEHVEQLVARVRKQSVRA